MHRAFLLAIAVCAAGQIPAQPDISERVKTLKLPPGFEISVFAGKVGGARVLAFSPSGVLYVSVTRDGKVIALPDPQHTGKAGAPVTIVAGLKMPHGIAWKGNDLYVAETDRVLVVKDADKLPASPLTPVELIKGIPEGGMHYTRTILFGRDGKLYLSAGSDCNLCKEADPRRAAITRYNADGTGEEVYASGLRNSVGLRLHPTKDEIWSTDNGRDYLGDDLPSEEVNIITSKGQDFGWPYCYNNRVPDPQTGTPERCATTTAPALQVQAHSAMLSFDFYRGKVFPEPYRSSVFVASHGSWNRTVPTGYKIMRLVIENDRPVRYEDFVAGWLGPDGRSWGRPVDAVSGPDGALYVSDDRSGTIYRIAYTGK